MKRLPLLLSVVAVVALSVSLAYWALQLFTLPQRPIGAAPLQSAPQVPPEAAASLFGGQAVTVAVSNYQLRGVVAAGNGRGSVAILSVDGKPGMALPVGAEVVQGVTVKEVQPRYVLISEGGAVKRIELLVETGKAGDNPAPGLQVPPPVQPQVQAQPQGAPAMLTPPPVTRMSGANQ